MKFYIKFFVLINFTIISCDTQIKQLDFVKKLSSHQVNSIRIYNYCESLSVSDSLLVFPCHSIVNMSPSRLIIPFNKVDSISDRHMIEKYKDFILKYDTLSYTIALKKDMDIRIALLLEFSDQEQDTLYFVGKNKIQVNEETVLQYKDNVKSIFHNK